MCICLKRMLTLLSLKPTRAVSLSDELILSDFLVSVECFFKKIVDLFLFLFRFLVEFDEFYRIIKLSMDSEQHYP